MSVPRLIVIGGGFGGLNAVRALKNSDIEILLIDRTNHHLFQPLLYEVATAALSLGNIATPIRQILRYQKNASVIMGDVAAIDKEQRQVVLTDGAAFSYDYLIVAPGASHSYFGNDNWEQYAPGLKTVLDATQIRENILTSFEKAEKTDDLTTRAKFLRFIVIGAGPTGVEMAGAIAQMAHKSLFENFRKIKPESAEVILIEGTDQVLPTFPKRLGQRAKRDLEALGVKVMLNAKVTDINADGVAVHGEQIQAGTVIWAAGNQASPLLKTLDAPLDKQGRVFVDQDLSLAGFPELFVIGDAAHVVNRKGIPLPGIAPVAIQEGRYVAAMIKNRIPKEKRPAFRYLDKGMLATIGKNKAVGLMGKVQVTGVLAWFAWSLIHIFYLISFRNRVIVMLQWIFLYLTGERTIRIITGSEKRTAGNGQQQ